MKQTPTFEITTQIGCSVNCKRYCPQEVITSRYTGPWVLSLAEFKELTKDVPTSYPIIFSGLSEPFLNQECPDMILWAHAQGHPIIVFSTLVGLTPENALRIHRIPFERFTLHLPDPYGVSKIPDTNKYSQVLNVILRSVENLWFMNMGRYFNDDHSENRVRGKYNGKRCSGWVTCDHLQTPDYFVLPNGDAYFCCQTRGQVECVGNLFNETYQQLLDKHSTIATRLRRDPKSICHECAIAIPYWLHPIRQLAGDHLVKIGKRYFT